MSLIFQRNLKPGFWRISGDIRGSVRTQDLRCASPPVTFQAGPPPNCAAARPAKIKAHPVVDARRWVRVFMGSSLNSAPGGSPAAGPKPRPTRSQLLFDAVAVENAVPRADVDAAVGFGKLTEVQPGLDVIAARPQRFAVLGIERIKRGVRGGGDAALGSILQTDVRISLRRGFTTGVAEDDAIRDDGGLALIEIARHPGGIERDFAFAVIDNFERHNAALLHRAVLDGYLV